MRVCPSADNGSRVRRDVSFLFMSVVPLDFSPFFFSLLTIPTYWSSSTSAWLPSSFLPVYPAVLPVFPSDLLSLFSSFIPLPPLLFLFCSSLCFLLSRVPAGLCMALSGSILHWFCFLLHEERGTDQKRHM